MTGMDATKLGEIAAKHGLRLVLEFGSVVAGQTHPRSDVDIAVLADHALSFDELADLTHDIQAFYPDREVDLALVNRADPLFLKKITERCRLLYGESRHLQELKIYAFRRYQDHRRYLALERDYVRRALRALAPS